MKTTIITLLASIAIVIAACSSSKKTTAPTAATAPASTFNYVLAPSSNGINMPGIEELTAIQSQYKDVTIDMLKEGHTLYTVGACINCHEAKNIYRRGEEQWKNIIDDMAVRAKITAAQKDAVYKYVLAMKATQPK